MRSATSARGRTATTSTDPAAGAAVLELLRDGELEPIGWLVGSSNNAMVVRVTPGDFLLPGAEARDMYRPTVAARTAARRVGIAPGV